MIEGLYGIADTPLSPGALGALLMDGTERLASCESIALEDIHGPRALVGVELETFGFGELFQGGVFRGRENLSDRRAFIRCVRWVEEGLLTGRRTTICGRREARHAVLFTLGARELGLDRATAWFEGRVGALSERVREAGSWGAGLR